MFSFIYYHIIHIHTVEKINVIYFPHTNCFPFRCCCRYSWCPLLCPKTRYGAVFVSFPKKETNSNLYNEWKVQLGYGDDENLPADPRVCAAHFIDEDVIPFKKTFTVKKSGLSKCRDNIALIDGNNSFTMPPLPSETKYAVSMKSSIGHDEDGTELFHSSLKDPATSTIQRNIKERHETVLKKMKTYVLSVIMINIKMILEMR